MEIFKLYQYDNTDFLGIIFNEKIEIGDIEKLTKYKWIKYISNIEIQGENNIFQGIAFDKVEISSIEMIENIFNIKWATRKFLNFSNLFIDVADIFQKTRNIEIRTIYLGLLSELAFIKKAQLLGINNILSFYSKNDFDNFDFHFKNKHQLDIKTGNATKNSFKLNLKQFEHLTERENEHDISIIFANWDTKNGMNLLDLFNSIDGIKNFDYIRNIIDELLEENNNIFEEYKIVIEKSEFIFFNKNLLPKVTINQRKVLVGAIFEIFAAEETKIDFETRLKELTNNV